MDSCFFFSFGAFWANFCGNIGLGFSRRGVLGKMVYQEQTVLFLQSGTGLTNFRSRTKLEVSSISLRYIFREHQVVLVELQLITGLKSQFLLIFHMMILLLWLVIGIPEITRLVSTRWACWLKLLLKLHLFNLECNVLYLCLLLDVVFEEHTSCWERSGKTRWSFN